jgi:predicted secreted protein
MTGIDGVGSAFAAAQYGLQSASDGISQAASNIAQRTAEDAVAPAQPIAANIDTNNAKPNSTSSTSRLTDDLIALNVSERNAQASAKVLGVADEMLGTIIDVLA